ncbi:bile acid:sodium symporter family protein [Vibrio gangliei]|uniref:bile acid:sodium symporter family protein n=1 Tax=Vibrio gangliei TaxID=2077090 RepID=UPI000D012EA6|nr:bile acid:sodium symporter family protein [Vibrio gangliei]
MLRTITQLFPLWAILISFVAYFQPALFQPLKGYIVPLLVIIMMAMGLTLTAGDFANVVKQKLAITVGIILQFTIMPLVALMISFVLGFSPELTVGMVLVGSVAGGTSSNVMCYLAKGDVALSISMTAISTLLGVVLTPLLSEMLAGQAVDVPAAAMLMSLVKIVLLPVAIGIVINQFAHGFTKKLEPVLPVVSMVAIVMIIGIVIALNASQFAAIGPIIALAVVLHNGFGLLSGYWVCRLLGFNETISRTIAFEVGLQNSGLATALAMKFFTPAAAMPGTLFSLWHNISGSILAGYWSRKPVSDDSQLKAKAESL